MTLARAAAMLCSGLFSLMALLIKSENLYQKRQLLLSAGAAFSEYRQAASAS